MRIIKLKWKNFKSYGNRQTVIDFEKDFNCETVLLSGINGSGKSSIREIIEFALYGKVDGFKLEDLPNRSNKNLEVSIKFQTAKDMIEIERGISPSYFRLLVNGVPDTRAGKRNIQEYIENELFDMPYSVFKNIIVISINSFKSFLTMSPKDKRDIIDKIFGFDIINDLAELVKVDKKILTQEIATSKGIINNIQNNISDIEYKIEKSSIETTQKNEQRLKTLKSSMIVYKNNIEDLDADIKKISEDVKIITEKYYKNETLIAELKQELIQQNNKFSLYKNNKCTECETDLTTPTHAARKDLLLESIKDIKTKIENIKNIQVPLLEDETTKRESINKMNENKNQLVMDFKQLSTEYKYITENNENIEVSALENVKTSLNNSLTEHTTNLRSYERKSNFLEVIEDAFSSNGIKMGAINNILPLLNKNIKESFENLSINFNVKIDANFDCIVTSMGEEVNVKTLSSGERTRVDFGIIISLIKIIKLQYPTLNILFLDEIFNTIDMESIDIIVDVVKQLSEQINMNIFMVSHNAVSDSLFDKRIYLRKVNNFTELKMINI